MSIPIATLAAIADAGGGFEICALSYSPEELMSFIGRMDTTAVARIRNACFWPADQLAILARTAPPGVVQYVF